MLYNFHSKVVKISHAGGKVIVSYKERAFVRGQDEASIDEDVVELFDSEKTAEEFLATKGF